MCSSLLSLATPDRQPLANHTHLSRSQTKKHIFYNPEKFLS
jgi:hypothetical protein